MRIRTWAKVFAILTVSTTSAAYAQESRARPGRAAEVERPNAVIELEEMLVEGEIEQPNAFYILNRTRLGHEVLDLRTSFLPEVVESVQGDPF